MTHTLRSARGYAWEKSVVNYFNKMGWFARRLGGASTGLPDVVCCRYDRTVKQGWLFSIECKSSTSDYTYVNNDQLIRCNDVAQGFGLYNSFIVLAFHFSRVGKKDKKTGENAKRKQKDWFFMFYNIENIDNISNLRCDYLTGKLTIIRYDKDIPVTAKYEKFDDIKKLESYLMIQLLI